MSHITTIKSRLKNLQAIKEWATSEAMKAKGFDFITNGQVRYYGGSTRPCASVLKCPGQYDIGITENKRGDQETLNLEADWSYGDFYSHLGVQQKNSGQVEIKLLEAQNEWEFRSWCDNKGYGVNEVVDEQTGKRRLEANVVTY